jgi:hypothetical protein
MPTTYTFHRAEDHAILAMADLNNLQQVIAKIGRSLPRSGDGSPRRVYVHNGAGVVGAGLVLGGFWTDTSPDDYHQFAPKAAQQRLASGLTEE